MEVVWRRFKSVYPYTPSRYDGVLHGDDDVAKLKQPLIGRDDEYNDPADDDYNEEEGGYYRESARHDYHYSNSSSRYPQKQQPQFDDHKDAGGFMMSVEPKFLRSLGKFTELAKAAFVTSSPSSQVKQKYQGEYAPVSSNSAHAVQSIRAMVRTRRKAETMDDITEKALAKMAMLTVACSVLLILAVCAHAS
uniref:Uncharacterized protein n=1 Tax=Globisporangium ultimum (strain ATCC 200006 / CBS 805.95 / DAOM BR144) TaxID=431595 RepID=K3WE79_GLOUD